MVTSSQITELVAQTCPASQYRGKRVLLIIPDGTRTAPLGLVFRELHRQLGEAVAALDVLVALGTHPPMSEAGICRRLEISETERRETYRRVKFFNHAWDNPAELHRVGALEKSEVRNLEAPANARLA